MFLETVCADSSKCFPSDRRWPMKCDRCRAHRPEPLDVSEPELNTRKRGPNIKDNTRHEIKAKEEGEDSPKPPKRSTTAVEGDDSPSEDDGEYYERPKRTDVRGVLKREHPGTEVVNLSMATSHLGARTAPRTRHPLRPRRTKIPPTPNQRKVLRVLIDSKEHIACPDSGSQENIIRESLVHKLDLEIHRGPEGLKEFELGSGKSVKSVGRAQLSVQLPGITLQKAKRWFYVFERCPVDLILGMEFLEEGQILTKNRYLLESCPAELRNISSLLWIGSPRDDNSTGYVKNRLRCSMDGRDLVAVADTGSDLNVMSFECAKREHFRIDTREEARTWVQFGDGSKTKTTGQVYVYSLSLDWRTTETPVSNHILPNLSNNCGEVSSGNAHQEQHDGSFCTVFHVLPGLPCDVIFGRHLLDQLDAFNRSPDLLSSSSPGNKNHFELKVLISLGRVAFKLCGSKHKKASTTPLPNTKEAHDDERHSEMFRRSQKKEEIDLMPIGQQVQAKAREDRRLRRWDADHATCIHCLPVYSGTT